MLQHAAVFYYSLDKHFCPKCGRKMLLSREERLVKKSDPDADQFYSMAELDGVSATKLILLKISYSVLKCPNCEDSYLHKDWKKYTIKRKNRIEVNKPINISHEKYPICGDKMKRWTRVVQDNVDADSEQIEKYLIVNYSICLNCKHEIYDANTKKYFLVK